MSNSRAALHTKLLAVPELRARYLQNLRRLANEGLSRQRLAPTVAQIRNLIDREIAADTRKLSAYEAFRQATADAAPATAATRSGGGVLAFAEARSRYLIQFKDTGYAAPAARGAR
jgi:hypothetical protein